MEGEERQMRRPPCTKAHWAYGSCRRPARLAISCVISASMGLASIPAAAGALGRQSTDELTLSFDKNSELARGSSPDQPLAAGRASLLDPSGISLGPHEPLGWALDKEGTGRLVRRGTPLRGTSLWDDANGNGEVDEGELEDLLPHARDGVVTLFAQWPEEALAELDDTEEREAPGQGQPDGREPERDGLGRGADGCDEASEREGDGEKDVDPPADGADTCDGETSAAAAEPPSPARDGAEPETPPDTDTTSNPSASEGEGPAPAVPDESDGGTGESVGHGAGPSDRPVAPAGEGTTAGNNHGLDSDKEVCQEGAPRMGKPEEATEGTAGREDPAPAQDEATGMPSDDGLAPIGVSYQELVAGMARVSSAYAPTDSKYVYPKLSFRGYFCNPNDRKGGWTGWSTAKTDNSHTDVPADAGRVLGGRIDHGVLSGLQVRWVGGTDSAGSVSYRLLYSDGSHSAWAKNGQTAGQDNVGGRSAIGFAVRLEGEALKHYSVKYRMHPLESAEQSKTVSEGDVSHKGIYADGIVIYLDVQENTVTFVNGEDGKVIQKKKVIYHSNASTPAPPTVRGRTFLRWDGDYKPVTADVTVTARYRKNRYTIAFEGNGATSGGTPNVQASYDEPSTLPRSGFKRTGHVFKGWARDPKASKPDYGEGQQVKNLSEKDGGTVRLHAVWQKSSQRLTVDPMGGTWRKSGSPTTLTQEYGSSTTLERPQRQGYQFQGWKLEGDGRVDGESYRFGEGDATVRAQWKAIRYSIHFDPNAEDADGSVRDLAATFDEDVRIPDGGFEREVFDLVGWNAAPDGRGKSYELGQSVRNLSSKEGEKVTLYAQWKPKRVKVRIPVAIHYEAKQDGSVHGPADGVVAIANQSDMGVHVSQISVHSGGSVRIVSSDPRDGEVELEMTPEGGSAVRLGDYARPSAPKNPLEWNVERERSLALNGLRGRVSDATLLVRERQVGGINWTVAPGDLRTRGVSSR